MRESDELKTARLKMAFASDSVRRTKGILNVTLRHTKRNLEHMVKAPKTPDHIREKSKARLAHCNGLIERHASELAGKQKVLIAAATTLSVAEAQDRARLTSNVLGLVAEEVTA